MQDKLKELRTRLGEVTDLYQASAVLNWDQETYMPPGGIRARSEQLSTLRGLAHQKFIADEIGQLLADLAGPASELDPDSDDASLVRVTQREYDKARKIPVELQAELARATSVAHNAWVKARAESDFAMFVPYLQKVLDLVIQKAEALGYEERIYDALLDEYEPEMKTTQVEAVFAELKAEIVPLLQAICERLDAVDDACLHGSFDEQKQWAVTMDVLKLMGFDFQNGRQDKAAHPFTTSFSCDDVRVTTRFDPTYFASALYSSMHEGGHGLYDQGTAPELERTLLAGGASLGVHESQSRMWENLVGRSRNFWRFYFPRLKTFFPGQFDHLDAEALYRAVNKVTPSLIRVEADEVTYNLHIMLRFEMETEILEGKIKITDAPEAWNAKMEAYLGITPPDDARGVLQDTHWSSGLVGYFPTYSLGTMLASQLFDHIRADLPDLDAQIEAGQFAPLLGWLRQNIHCHGAKFTPNELVRRVIGEPMQAAPFVTYLKTKYGELYGI